MTVAGALPHIRSKAIAQQERTGFNTIASTSATTTEALRQVVAQLRNDDPPPTGCAQLAIVRDFLALIYPKLESFVRQGRWFNSASQRRRLNRQARSMVRSLIVAWNREIRDAAPGAPILDACDHERWRTKAKEPELIARRVQSLKARQSVKRSHGVKERIRPQDYVRSISWFGEVFAEVAQEDSNYRGIVAPDEADRLILDILRESAEQRRSSSGSGNASSAESSTSRTSPLPPPMSEGFKRLSQEGRRAVNLLARYPAKRIVTVTNDGDDIAIMPAGLRGWSLYPLFNARCIPLNFPSSPSQHSALSQPPPPPPTRRANPALSKKSERQGGELGARCIVYSASGVDALPGFGPRLERRVLRALIQGHDYTRGGLRGIGPKALDVLDLAELQAIDWPAATADQFSSACFSDFKLLSSRSSASATRRRVLSLKTIKGHVRPDQHTSEAFLRAYRTMLSIGTVDPIDLNSLHVPGTGSLAFEHARNQHHPPTAPASSTPPSRTPSPPPRLRPNPPRQWDHPLRPGRNGTPLVVKTRPRQLNPWHDHLECLEPEPPRPPVRQRSVSPSAPATSPSPAPTRASSPASASSYTSSDSRAQTRSRLHEQARELEEEEEAEGEAEQDEEDEKASASSSSSRSAAKPAQITGLYRPASTAQLPLDAVERCLDDSLIGANPQPQQTSQRVRTAKRRPGSWKKLRDRHRFTPYASPRARQASASTSSPAGSRPTAAGSAPPPPPLQLRRLRPVAYVARLLFLALSAANMFAMPVFLDYLATTVRTEDGVREVGRSTQQRGGIARVLGTICTAAAYQSGGEAVGAADRKGKLLQRDDLKSAIGAAIAGSEIARPVRLAQDTYNAAYAPYDTNFRMFAARTGGDIVDLFGFVASSGLLNAEVVAAQTFARPSGLLSPESERAIRRLQGVTEWFGFVASLESVFRTVAEELPYSDGRAATGAASPAGGAPSAQKAAKLPPLLSTDQLATIRSLASCASPDNAVTRSRLEHDIVKVLGMLAAFRDRGLQLALLQARKKPNSFGGKKVAEFVRIKDVRRALAGFGVKLRFIMGTQAIPSFAPDFFSSNVVELARCLDEVWLARLASGAARVAEWLVSTLQPRLVEATGPDRSTPEILRTVADLFDPPSVDGLSNSIDRLLRAIHTSRLTGRPVRLRARPELLDAARRTRQALTTAFGVSGSLATFARENHAQIELMQCIFRTDIGPAHFAKTGAFTFSGNSVSFYGLCTHEFLDTARARSYVGSRLEGWKLDFDDLDEGTAWALFGSLGWTKIEPRKYAKRDTSQLEEYRVEGGQVVSHVVPQVLRRDMAVQSVVDRFARSVGERPPRATPQVRIEPGSTLLHSFSPMRFVRPRAKTRNGIPVSLPSLRTEQGRREVNDFVRNVDARHLRLNGADMGLRNIAALAHDHPFLEASGARVEGFVQGASIYSSGTSLQMQQEQSRLMAYFGARAAAGLQLGLGAVPPDVTPAASPRSRPRSASSPPLSRPTSQPPPTPPRSRPRAYSAPPTLASGPLARPGSAPARPGSAPARPGSAPPDVSPRLPQTPPLLPPRPASAPARSTAPLPPAMPPPLRFLPLDETFDAACAVALRTNTRRADLRQFGKTRRTAELQRAASQACDMLTGKGMVPESELEQRRTLVYLGEDVGFNRGERQHGPDERGRFVRLLDTELRRRPGEGLIARTSEFETSQRCSNVWCRNGDGTRSSMHIVQRSDGSPDYGLLECDNCGLVANRDVVAAFNLIGMGEMQRVYGEGVWRREN